MKDHKCFSNISAQKYPSKMVHYSKRTFVCQVSNETDRNHVFCLFLKKNKQTPWYNLLKCFKKIAPWVLPDFSINQKPPWLGWGVSHLRPDIQRSVLSTETFLRAIWGLRYLKNNIELLVNH